MVDKLGGAVDLADLTQRVKEALQAAFQIWGFFVGNQPKT
jgi:hypothetical protein